MNILWCTILLGISLKSAYAIRCYVCNATDNSAPFQCGEWFERFDRPDIAPHDCSAVHGAKYCIKHIGRFEGGIGAKRYCSSKDLGNYCDYVRNVGDQMEYRSCIFTCSTDGCNSSVIPTLSGILGLLVPLIALINHSTLTSSMQL